MLSFLVLILSPLFLNWHLILGSETYHGLTSLLGSARGASLGIIFGLMVACGSWLSFQEVKIKKYFGIVILVIAFIGVVLGGVSILNKTSFLHQKFAENVGENRFIFWDSAVKGFEESPFLGIGPNNFDYSFHKFFNADILLLKNGSEVLVDRTHNIFFETLVSGGVLLMLALCFLFISIIFGLTKLLKNKQLSELETAIFIGMFFGWLLQAQFVFDSINSLIMLFLVCGISYGSFANKPDDTKQKNNSISTKEKFIVTLFIIIIIVLFIYSIRCYC
jgi:O-antigen ligase